MRADCELLHPCHSSETVAQVLLHRLCWDVFEQFGSLRRICAVERFILQSLNGDDCVGISLHRQVELHGNLLEFKCMISTSTLELNGLDAAGVDVPVLRQTVQGSPFIPRDCSMRSHSSPSIRLSPVLYSHRA